MSDSSSFLVTLQEKERELDSQLEAVRTTIKIFQNGHPVSVPEGVKINTIPKNYEEAQTWNSKIVFALSKIQSGFVQDIVNELLKYSKEIDEKTLFKKVTTLASVLKKKKVLGGKLFGNKMKYFIR